MSLLDSQNSDGGWGYNPGHASWTEPTVMACLALIASGQGTEAVARASAWLQSVQRGDGGWPPRPSVDLSSWVTCLPLLLEDGLIPATRKQRALAWIRESSGRETRLVQRIRGFLVSGRDNTIGEGDGWPWYPETAAWVTPTALTIVGLENNRHLSGAASLSKRVDSARRYLLSHRCADGGWNHGASESLGYASNSYPETTGAALLGLRGVPTSALSRSFAYAENAARSAHSSEAVSWVRLGLLTHGIAPELPSPALPSRTIPIALDILSRSANPERNPFLRRMSS